MTKSWLMIFVLLAGCAAPSVVASTPRTVIVRDASALNIGEALAVAERECQKHGRHAVHRPDGLRDGRATYECVE